MEDTYKIYITGIIKRYIDNAEEQALLLSSLDNLSEDESLLLHNTLVGQPAIIFKLAKKVVEKKRVLDKGDTAAFNDILEKETKETEEKVENVISQN